MQQQQDAVAQQEATTTVPADPRLLMRDMLTPNSKRYKILFRKDDVHVHPMDNPFSSQPQPKTTNTTQQQQQIPGCIFLVEDVAVSKLLYFTWAPYTLLAEINDRLVTHFSSTDMLTRADMEQQQQQQQASNVQLQASGYMSAKVAVPTTTTNTTSTTKVTNKKQGAFSHNMYTLAVPLQDIKSIKRHIPTMGWSFMVISMKMGAAHPPLFFHDGGILEFFNKLQQFAQIHKSKEDANVYHIVDCAQEPLQNSLSKMHFDEYFEDVYKSNSQPNLSWQLLEWGARVKKKASNMIFGNQQQSVAEPKPKIIDTPAVVTKYADLKSKINANHLGTTMVQDADTTGIIMTSVPTPKSGDVSEDMSFEIIGDAEKKEAFKQAVMDHPEDMWTLPPLSEAEWIQYFDSQGRITDVEKLRAEIFFRGLDNSIRGEVWKYLLGYYKFSSTYEERKQQTAQKKVFYDNLKKQWTTITDAQAKRFALYKERKHRIEKDVVRTDRTHPLFETDNSPYLIRLNDILMSYSFFNFDLGYCQGMSDLLSPILSVIQDEVECYATFEALMEVMDGNFQHNSTSMETQLLTLNHLVKEMDFELYSYLEDHDATNFFFCFRWVLILFKREFDFEQVKRLWDAMWSQYCGSDFHLFMCLSILKDGKKEIISKQMPFDEILKYCVDLSNKLDPVQTLQRAYTCYVSYKDKQEKIQKKK